MMLTASHFDLGPDALIGEFRQVAHPQLTVSAQRVADRFKLTLGTIHSLPETILEAKGYSVERSDSSSRQLQYVSFVTRSAEMNGAFVAVMSEALERSAAASDPEQSLSVFLDVLDEFRRLTQRRRGALSEDELRGLVAELVMFKHLLDAEASPSRVAKAWRGPYGASFDFVFDAHSAMEVKSVHVGAKEITVSSPEQLDVDIADLRLAVVPMEETADESPDSQTVSDLVGGIRQTLKAEPPALGLFDDALAVTKLDPQDRAIAGYRFSTSSPKCYHVGDDFPAIRLDSIPAGVANVTYSLSLQALTAFEVPLPSPNEVSTVAEADHEG